MRKEHEITESKIREQACRVDEQLFQRQRLEVIAVYQFHYPTSPHFAPICRPLPQKGKMLF
jgi:hypothetical protein